MRSLRKRVAFLQQMQAALDAGLPEMAHGHVQVADYSGHRLLLIADSGVWATRLRYQQDAIRRAMARRLRFEVKEVAVRVRPPAHPAPAEPMQPRVLSPAARQLLAASAGHVDNPALARALARLSRCETT